MEQKRSVSEQSTGSTRSPYEAPAIEQTASFERLTLMCSRTPEEFELGICTPLDTTNS